ncbi:glycyl radical enzyme family protein [Caproiciproducens faecalis]|uniref:Zinc ribbon domain-containing protein n=1 Tax=Caproiciproducens faecalis TaxID=2820301 RepID=A0ABS7DNM0_9FIRM|nr:hypothetical protein [Caproiciproducens faecalis]MBW7572892.1 hypothetical protein [Caproiciproducens faecalis]
MMIVSLVMLAVRVLFGLAAYHDASSKSNPDATMWGLLVGFLGIIPGIIYLCIRNSSGNYLLCPNCGFKHYLYDAACPRCGAPTQAPAQNINPLAAQQARRARLFLTIGIVLIGITVLAAVVCFVGFIASVSVRSHGIYY